MKGIDATAIYIVLVWASPEGEGAFVKWLDEKHLKEVVAEPGFTGCRRLKLSQKNGNGWAGHMVIYELDSAQSLANYLASDRRVALVAEGLKFKGVTMERFDGSVEKILSS